MLASSNSLVVSLLEETRVGRIGDVERHDGRPLERSIPNEDGKSSWLASRNWRFRNVSHLWLRKSWGSAVFDSLVVGSLGTNQGFTGGRCTVG